MSESAVVDFSRAGRYGAPGTAQFTLQARAIAAAWNVQGDPDKPAFVAQSESLFGLALPVAPNTTQATDALTAVWLGPTSWLLLAGGPLPAAHPLTAYTAKRDALNAAGGALFDVTTSRVAWALGGPRAADVLASGCPLDFHPRAFAPGSCAQSLFGHVNALVCRRANGDFSLLVARSMARDVGLTLGAAGAQYGCEVLAPAPFR